MLLKFGSWIRKSGQTCGDCYDEVFITIGLACCSLKNPSYSYRFVTLAPRGGWLKSLTASMLVDTQ